ncbi:endospore germination permease [Neobacillus sp. WH10]|uniref:GerAB/ArcD/ProY family transporter n=1 Tax=Neobacillus sp. WH10 TaxID=3047873 RepID=UPI0024C1D0BE|nr:endospore germination permease [Neobacillus sp. WH10]WHY78339.1 endospore germination permease [Neobacillus sp. WH10]
MKSSISLVQTVMIIFLSTGLLNHIIIIPILLDVAKRDAWVSVLLAGTCSLVWIALLCIGIRKMHKQHLFEWIKQAYHPLVGHLLAIVASVYLFVLCAVTVRDTVHWIHLAFSPNTPILILTFILVLISAINAFLGINSLANTAGFLLPLVIILGLFLMFANIPHRNFSFLKPILAHGMQPVWNGSIYVGAGLVELIMLFFLQHHIQSRISYRSLGIISLLLMFLTIGPLISAVVEFGPEEAAKLRFPVYEEWRLVTIGRYVEHLDFLSIYQWFCGAFLRISLMMFLIIDVFNIQTKRKKMIMLSFIFFILVGITIIPYSDPVFLHLQSKYILPYSLFGILIFSIIVVGLINFGYRREKLNP